MHRTGNTTNGKCIELDKQNLELHRIGKSRNRKNIKLEIQRIGNTSNWTNETWNYIELENQGIEKT